MFAAMRLVLASSALLIIWIDPAQPDRYVPFTYGALILYTVYSLVIYALVLHQSQSPLHRCAHWIDVGWYTILVGLSSGTNSIFFFGFLFAVLVASSRWGFGSGLRVAIISAAIFTAVGFATIPSVPQFELNRFLLQPIYLLVIGSMIAYRGGTEIRLRHRNEVLRDIATLSNPRFGADHTIGSAMKRLREFYDADACLLVLSDRDGGKHSLRRVKRQPDEEGASARPIPAELAAQLLQLPDQCALLHRNNSPWRGWGMNSYISEAGRGQRLADSRNAAQALAALLDAESFITVPLQYHGASGRLFLTAGHWVFHNSDVDFLLQVVGHLMPIINNIRLVDRLASHAAEEERQRIARDIHDSVIQPYIGLQVGLTATRQDVAAGGSDVVGDLDRLIAMTGMAIEDLRHYVRVLKDDDDAGERTNGRLEGSLLPAVRRFADKFTAATGIAVRTEAKAPVLVTDRLAAEVFQMVVEGLSNIRRHTRAACATIHIDCHNDRLVLCIQNEGADQVQDAPFQVQDAPFTPRSISERAAALGGQVQVTQNSDVTHVVVEIPL